MLASPSLHEVQGELLVIFGQQSEDLARQHVKLGWSWHALGVAAPVGAAPLWILR